MNKSFLAVALILSILMLGWMGIAAASAEDVEAESPVSDQAPELTDAGAEDADEASSHANDGDDMPSPTDGDDDALSPADGDGDENAPSPADVDHDDATSPVDGDEGDAPLPTDGDDDDAQASPDGNDDDAPQAPEDEVREAGDIPEPVQDESELPEVPLEDGDSPEGNDATDADDGRAEGGLKPSIPGAWINPRDCQHPVTVIAVNRDGVDVEYEDLGYGAHRITGSSVRVEVCADCGMVIDRQDSCIEACTYERREGYGTVCKWCGHIMGDGDGHVHSYSGPYQTFPGKLLESVPDADDPELYHISHFQKNQARKCDECEAYEDPQEVPGETIDVREYHVWGSDGRCAVCGYERDCHHGGAIYEDEWLEDESYTFVNASVHERSAIRYVQRCCAMCGEPVGNVEVTRITEQQPHHYREGRCAECGYLNLCDHRDMRYTYSIDEDAATYTAVDGLTHRVRGGITIVAEYCPDCGILQTGMRFAPAADREIEMPHRFNDEGVCVDCGYAAQATKDSCEHPEEYRVALDRGDVDALKRNCSFEVATELSTESEHVLRVSYDPSWVCALCGHREDLSGSPENITVREPHRFHNGYCVTADCGYRCAHSSVEGSAQAGKPFYEDEGAEGHCLVTPLIATGRCKLCGEYVKNHIVQRNRGPQERHSMDEGVCVKCGYVCPHPATEIVQLLPAVRASILSGDADGHWVYEERVTETLCLACGYTLFEETEPMGTRKEPHRWVDGVCADCGYADNAHAAMPDSAPVG